MFDAHSPEMFTLTAINPEDGSEFICEMFGVAHTNTTLIVTLKPLRGLSGISVKGLLRRTVAGGAWPIR